MCLESFRKCKKVATLQDCLSKKQGSKAAAKSKTKFLTCSFSLRFPIDFSWTQDNYKAHKAATRLLQGTQGVCTADVVVRHPRICLTKAARLPQDNCALYCRAVARMPQNLQLQLKIAQWPQGEVRELYDVSLFLATVLQILHDHLAAALHVT